MLRQVQEGVTQMRGGLATEQSVGVRCYLRGKPGSGAEAHAKSGHPEKGLTTPAEALASVEQMGERTWEAGSTACGQSCCSCKARMLTPRPAFTRLKAIFSTPSRLPVAGAPVLGAASDVEPVSPVAEAGQRGRGSTGEDALRQC